DGDFSESKEKSLLELFGKFISKKDDIARIDRLLWEGKTTSATRMLARVDANHQKLYKARMALQADKKNVSKILSELPAIVKKDSGLLYDRMCFHARRDDSSGVSELLLSAPKKISYPEKWWRYRGAKIREAMIDGNTSLAMRLLANHGQEYEKNPEGFADASWLKGRLLLDYKKHPKEAYKVFDKMFSVVKYPVSKSRAAYWAAKAAKDSGDKQAAKKWFNTASDYPTTFYGQLASAVYYGTTPLRIPAAPTIDNNVREEFDSRSIVRAVNLCISSGEMGLAEKLINHLVKDADSDDEALLASELGIKAGKAYLSVRGAKKALQNNVSFIDAGYPMPKTPENLELPRELTLSITRQESEFNESAISPSGALGLMQLLPSTAKETAYKNGLDYNTKQLYESEYNMTLGSMYLQQMIDKHDGSVIMAIAAYNGGPGNVRKWIKKFGRPANNIDSTVAWIENIPFSETRNYVQSVLANLQIYRYIEAQKSSAVGRNSAKLLLGDDLLK
ncbi:MAG: lytic transglycosylase domain-containing protein, partial [Rickettsiales bacterium]